ncbi:CidA/LrgA family protein [Indiicoccus explosivorum]|uniref:CidA/LrgA family protein n=1 Tax=Indiicoccus explosivorum TaxID=1917864 RepID=UPI000B438EA7|nr:CidA/LrgA family protein [Indiicoccus explosivorum]
MDVRKGFRIVMQVAVLYLFFLLGEAVVAFFGLIIPGSVVGLLLLLTGLLTKVVPISLIEDGAKAMLLFLPLFFVPATVGIIEYPEFLSSRGALLIVMVLVSTCISLISAGWTGQLLERHSGEAEGEG